MRITFATSCFKEARGGECEDGNLISKSGYIVTRTYGRLLFGVAHCPSPHRCAPCTLSEYWHLRLLLFCCLCYPLLCYWYQLASYPAYTRCSPEKAHPFSSQSVSTGKGQ